MSTLITHLHAGGCDACRQEWAAAWPEAAGRGLRLTLDWPTAPVLAVTGVPNELGAEPLAAALLAWAAEGPGTLLLVGDCAINGGLWAKLGAPGVLRGVPLPELPAGVQIVRVAGDPPAPEAILAALLNCVS